MKLILASASPRRREILTGLGLGFTVVTAPVDESLPKGLMPDEAVLRLARAKAEPVSTQYPGHTVLAADTLVCLDGALLGKPRTAAEAKAMLQTLSGRTHQVYTGVCILRGTQQERFCACTDVTFYPLTEAVIADYVTTGEPMDKAGAYGIQGRGATLVAEIRGDYFNVMGLPSARVYWTLMAMENRPFLDAAAKR